MWKLSYLLLLFSFCFVYGEEKNSNFLDGWKISGYTQMRTEMDGRDFSNKTYPLLFSHIKINVSVEKTILNKITFFMQLQDSRMFGQTKNTIRTIGNIDLHQGFVRIDSLLDGNFWFQVGRYEMPYGSQRIFGTNPWNHIGRAFDGLRVGYQTDLFNIDAFNLVHTLNNEFIGNATPGIYSYPANPDTSHSVYGFWSKIKFLGKDNGVDIYGYYEINRKETNGNPNVARYTTGFNYNFRKDKFDLFAELDYQFGKAKGIDISAYLARFIARYRLNPITVSAAIDIQSGNRNSGQINLFDATFGAKHMFNGNMDYFSRIEQSTMGLGLNDYFIRAQYEDKNNPWVGIVEVHYFTSNQKSQSGLIDFGPELDLVLRYMFTKSVFLEWGGSLFFPGKLMEEVYTIHREDLKIIRNDIGFWSYLMLRAAI